MIENLYLLLDKIILNALPKESTYIFKKQLETKDEYKFILLIDEKVSNSKLFKKNSLIKTILDALNLEVSKYEKKISIDVEVYDELG
ncbi:hypothetical protein [Spiroplasma tabanidicola]|uniref:Uncharacterized protein n=1 Tax=Spiroplasma tabanidicola TaxID=324079 RepID=A0A6I6C6H1_9MOLU|nr:hypothetical protein [Spiroplasma tabanidicola]QGS51760.1 hypothetical protein STABA_v1c03970 [Spiroplasma tabanidicola]